MLARRALRLAQPSPDDGINQAALDWARFTLSVILCIGMAVVGFAIYEASVGSTRAIALFIESVLELSYGGRFARRYYLFQEHVRRQRP